MEGILFSTQHNSLLQSYLELIDPVRLIHKTYETAVLEIVFESVQQQHLDKTIFLQNDVDFIRKTLHKYKLLTDTTNASRAA